MNMQSNETRAKELPSPEQISARSAVIRKRWSRQTENRRRVGGDHLWRVPNIDLTDLDFSMTKVA
ncbi:hypothetical protein N9M41_02145 [Rhodopirellula sp.]|jgi:hypothetical protein|nr:hypothetical protein [Rhodopirellula sp.]MDA9777646.1 hypothetical protein [Rubripirellula sp.]